MKANINNICMHTIILYFGTPHIITKMNNERTVYYLAEYKGKFDRFDAYDYIYKNSNYEVPLCEIEKCDVVFAHGDWIKGYRFKIPLKINIYGFSEKNSGSDVDDFKFKIVNTYEEILKKG